ncbi:unnamed protein product [Gulo gulo]|uniref:Uncharacterized protein n=1 Tax=Gulo gulo TaxID=48420 RepID=A0A9X9PT06_GULGU|nr:unnamed protein product [Gulo gulo]
MLSSLLCQLGVDFPLPPISDWVFCLSMEAGDLRLTPNLWRLPPNKGKDDIRDLQPEEEDGPQANEQHSNEGPRPPMLALVCSGAETVVMVNTNRLKNRVYAQYILCRQGLGTLALS